VKDEQSTDRLLLPAVPEGGGGSAGVWGLRFDYLQAVRDAFGADRRFGDRVIEAGCFSRQERKEKGRDGSRPGTMKQVSEKPLLAADERR
jgi:hypothetical protein